MVAEVQMSQSQLEQFRFSGKGLWTRCITRENSNFAAWSAHSERFIPATSQTGSTLLHSIQVGPLSLGTAIRDLGLAMGVLVLFLTTLKVVFKRRRPRE